MSEIESDETPYKVGDTENYVKSQINYLSDCLVEMYETEPTVAANIKDEMSNVVLDGNFDALKRNELAHKFRSNLPSFALSGNSSIAHKSADSYLSHLFFNSTDETMPRPEEEALKAFREETGSIRDSLLSMFDSKDVKISVMAINFMATFYQFIGLAGHFNSKSNRENGLKVQSGPLSDSEICPPAK